MNHRLLVLPALLAIACATPYQARRWAGGYTDEKVENDVYQVTFAANGNTEDETARTYLKYRCAELTRQNGFDHFVVLESVDLTDGYVGPDLKPVIKPAHTAKIRLGKGPKPDAANAYVAEAVLKELEPHIKR